MEKLYYIQNHGYCGNALFWWAENDNGYVTDIRKAGKFNEEKAKKRTEREEDTAFPVEYIDNLLESQKLIIDCQYVDKKQSVNFNKK
jgi:hypothetical protein